MADGERLTVSIKEACRLLGVSRWTLRSWVRGGHLAVSKVSRSRTGRVLIEKTEIERFLRDTRTPRSIGSAP